jgi:hypothetical protein
VVGVGGGCGWWVWVWVVGVGGGCRWWVWVWVVGGGCRWWVWVVGVLTNLPDVVDYILAHIMHCFLGSSLKKRNHSYISMRFPKYLQYKSF